MQKNLTWAAYSDKNRHEIIGKVKNTITSNDGCILNFNMFSDLALTLSIEIPADRINGLHNDLRAILTISDIGSTNSFQKAECLILLNLSFAKGTGDLKSEIPDVPG